MSSEIFASGRCLCGAVGFQISSPPVRMSQCHCKDCQRVSGTGHTSQAFFKAADVEIRGELSSFAVTADSGNIVTRYFCPTCGSRVWNENTARPGIAVIAVGGMENSDWFEPEVVVFTRSRAKWDWTSPEIANFEAMQAVPKQA